MIISNGSVLDFAPQALGEIIPNIANGYFYPREGIHLIGRYAIYGHMYTAQPSIATVVDKVAGAGARLPVKVWDITNPAGKTVDAVSPYAQLLSNPSSVLPRMAFYRWSFSTYEVYGECFWYKQRANTQVMPDGTRVQTGPVVNLLPMHPSRTAIRRDVEGNIEYVFTLGVASAGILRAPAEDVVPFLRYNPDSLMRGLSRLEPLRVTLRNEDAARRANEAFWAKGARPGIFLSHPASLSQPAQDRLKANFEARHIGPDNAGSTAVLEEGMKAQIIQLSAEEMQYIDSRKMNMQEVCMVYDVPPPAVHILDHATFSNITEQMRSVYRDTMTPRLEDFESVIDYYLRPEFFASGQREAKFDMSQVLRGDFETRADKSVELRNSGLVTGNEGREIVGFERLDDPEMDKVYANAAIAPLGAPKAAISITEAATASPAETQQVHAAVTSSDQAVPAKSISVRSIMGRVSRKVSKADARKQLVVEHQTALDAFFAQQQKAVKSSPSNTFDPDDWDGDLAEILHTLSAATAKAIGAKVAAELGGTYDGSDIADWLQSNSQATAKKINASTLDEIASAIAAKAKAAQDAGQPAPDDQDDDDTVDDVYGGVVSARKDQISVSRVALVAGLAALVAARQSGAKTKTWVTGANPRDDHAEMDGETVPLGDDFSNGMDGPGDYSGGADEVANCNCDLEFGME